jgi:glyoxylase-like metal-dependent hydrolase (beta-lactamase superfamily II)
MSYALRFLGTGAAHAVSLGSSAVVIERDDRPLLLVDCGPDTLDRYVETYGAPPAALYITHTHMDHVAGMERLFFRLWFDEALRGRTRVFLHANLLPWLQGRVADYPGALAEGGVNYWEAFHLLPCTRGFWHEGLWWDVFPTRHHVQGTSYGLALRGSFVFTGDTRPVPEALAVHAAQGELIAHDCGVVGNPSHTGVDDLDREYPAELHKRMVLYHYGSEAEGDTLAGHGYRVARPGDRLSVPEPHPTRPTAG